MFTRISGGFRRIFFRTNLWNFKIISSRINGGFYRNTFFRCILQFLRLLFHISGQTKIKIIFSRTNRGFLRNISFKGYLWTFRDQKIFFFQIFLIGKPYFSKTNVAEKSEYPKISIEDQENF